MVTFSRSELRSILDVYGRMVARGAWHDYAMTFRRDVASFAVYGRHSGVPRFRIEKRPDLAFRQGAYAVIASDGRAFRRGREIKAVLRAFE